MPKKFKYRKPRTSTMSPTPLIYPTRSAIKNMNMVRQMPGRVERGRQLFLLAMAAILREEIRKRAPDVQVGSNVENYANDLRIALVSGVANEDAVAIYFEHATAELTQDRQKDTALFVKAHGTSPEWVDVLVRFGPWPATMIPVPLEEKHATVVSRKARPDELKALSDRLYFRREEIESLLVRAGAENPRVERTENGVGIVAREDVGYNVLRKEFGFDGERQESHWRPALKAMQNNMRPMMQRYMKYLMTGREVVFQLPGDVGKLGATQFQQGAKFQDELAPFAPAG